MDTEVEEQYGAADQLGDGGVTDQYAEADQSGYGGESGLYGDAPYWSDEGQDSQAQGGDSLVVILYAVLCSGGVEERYQACGNEQVAGPFLSAGSAIEWRDEFCPAGILDSYSTDDADRCQDPALMKQGGEWVRR